MNKKSILCFLFLLFSFVFGISVKAETTNYCTTELKNELSKKASSISISYEVESVEKEYPRSTIEGGGAEEGSTYNVDYMNVKIYNLTSDIMMRGRNTKTGNEFEISYRDIGPDGAVTISKLLSSTTSVYEFEAYGNFICGDVKLRSYKITVPRYNPLSDMPLCADIQDYYLCQPLVSFEINSDTAYKLISNYASLDKKEITDDAKIEDNENIISTTFTTLSNHKKLVAIVIVLVGVVLTLVILKRKRSDK